MRQYDLVGPLSLLSNFDKDFNEFFNPRFDKSGWKPLSRVKEEGNHYHLALDIPGVDSENLKVDLKENILSIKGERKDHFFKDNAEVENYSHFEQSFSLPKDANLDEIEVSHDNGVLDVVIPKASKENESKVLEVKKGKSNFFNKLLK
ncbi:MAG: Hsp20/alpha crystallin family protein [Bacteriovoracaceae bacterium]|jgi:HSP20 family protein|nr:heat-shock protein Hsp20 [Halobacteriovoraceae bacterium]MDP7320414.1 Hsp20/alpha crystallin family protein [Bacteriovoracaceae bacterium]|tara:strand:+ start:83 stop:526 length:444 start_codon:yes stop_codon:yes gene_type:complete